MSDRQGPANAMKRIGLPLESYQHPSPPLSAKRLLNMMAEQQPDDARSTAALVPTPGLTLWDTIGPGPIRAFNSDLPSYIYLISGDQFYRIQFGPGGTRTTTNIGTVGTPEVLFPFQDFCTIAVSPEAAVACVPPNAFTCTHAGLANQLGGTFPGNASSVTWFDGYFVFTDLVNAQNFFISRLSDPTDYDALDFASPTEGFPNSVTKVLTLGANLWFLGYSGIEIWYDAGAADFPFRRMSGGLLQRSVATPRGAVIADGSVFWVTVDGMVMRSVGYQPKRLSTHAIEEILRAIGVTAIVSAVAYVQRGHTFYAINFPDRTLVYDCATDKWHERASDYDGASRWRPDACARNTENPLLGDYQTGQIWEADPFSNHDADIVMLRSLTLPPLWAGTARAFCARVEVEMETGALGNPSEVFLSWSDDGGRTTAINRSLTSGSDGAFRKRVVATRLGSFRERIFTLSCHGELTVYAIDADIAGGAW